MARSTPRHESPQPLPDMSDHAVHPRLASSASLNTTSATNSDNEGGEKPVREKLKQTTIAGLPQDVPSPEVDMEDVADEVPAGKKTPQGEKDAQSGSESDRGRVGRKRSFDDIDDLKTPEKPEPERHTRKRSRDIKAGDLEQYRKSSGESSVSRIDEHDGGDPMTSTESRPTTPSDSATKAESMGSPKSKRVREEEERLPSNIDQAGVSKDDAVEERQPKRHRDSNSPKSSTEEDKPMRVKISPGSGFANVSAASPFASLGSKQSGFGSFGSKKDDETAKSGDAKSQTSTSAFQKSGLGSFASASSPFASLNSTGSASPFSAAASTGSASPFGAAATTAKPSLAFGGATKSPTSSENGFAALGSSGKSTFGNASGFGGGFGAGSAFGGGFGGLSKPAGSGFAAPGTSGITGLSDKPAKPFGAQEDDDEDSGSDDGDDHDDEDAKPHHVEEGGRDRRFYAQEVSTGEEDEDTVFVNRAKIFSFSGKTGGGWKERGVGDLKLNVPKHSLGSSGDDGKPAKKPRLIMRAEGTKRIILNWPLQKSLGFGTHTGEKPANQQVLFMGQLVGSEELVQISLKMKQERAQELWQHVKDLQKDM